MRLQEVERKYPDCRIAFRHNPEHFYPNSFSVEVIGPRRLVVARVKRHVKKQIRIVGFLKVRK